MKTIGNILWFLFGGLIGGLSWVLAGCLWCITIVGIPVGDIQADDLLLSAEEHQAMLAQGEAPYNWESESGQVS